MIAVVKSAPKDGPDGTEIRDCPVPKPGPGEVLIRVAAAAICGTVNVGSANPITKLNGFPTDDTTVRMVSMSCTPGEYSTSAPAASNACNRLMVSSRSLRPHSRFSARAVSVNGKDNARFASTAARMRSAACVSS